MKRIVVQDRQTIYDLAIQYYGSVEGVLSLLEDNPIEFESGLQSLTYPGQIIKIKSVAKDKTVLDYVVKHNVVPVTKISESELIGGDYNEDYNFDHLIP